MQIKGFPRFYGFWKCFDYLKNYFYLHETKSSEGKVKNFSHRINLVMDWWSLMGTICQNSSWSLSYFSFSCHTCCITCKTILPHTLSHRIDIWSTSHDDSQTVQAHDQSTLGCEMIHAWIAWSMSAGARRKWISRSEIFWLEFDYFDLDEWEWNQSKEMMKDSSLLYVMVMLIDNQESWCRDDIMMLVSVEGVGWGWSLSLYPWPGSLFVLPTSTTQPSFAQQQIW